MSGFDWVCVALIAGVTVYHVVDRVMRYFTVVAELRADYAESLLGAGLKD